MSETPEFQELCSQCKRYYDPSLIESGWCIFCICKDLKKQLAEQRNKVLEEAAEAVSKAGLVAQKGSRKHEYIKAGLRVAYICILALRTQPAKERTEK